MLVAETRRLIDDQKFDEALGKLAFATDLAPGLARAHLLRGHVLQTQLHFAEAIASLQTALSLARDPALATDARANLALCEKIQAENRDQSEVLSKSLNELTEAFSRQGRTAEALALAPRAGLAEKFRYEEIFIKLKALLKVPEAESSLFRKRLRLDGNGLFALNLDDLPISDLSPLKSLPIYDLNLSRCANLSDLSPLKGMPLDNLDISTTKVSDLSPLRGMKLNGLAAWQSKIHDLSPLAGMPLTYLEIHSTDVSSLAPLAGMPLKELILLWTGISDIRPLQGMPLEVLVLEDTKVADITVLSGMPLRVLQLGGTKVRDVAMLAEFTALETLTIPDNAINVDALRHLTNLKLIGYHFQRLSSPPDFWAEYEAKNKGLSNFRGVLSGGF